MQSIKAKETLENVFFFFRFWVFFDNVGLTTVIIKRISLSGSLK